MSINMTSHCPPTTSAEFRRLDPVWYAVDDFGEIGHWHESELTSTDGMYRTREEAEAAAQKADDEAQAARDALYRD